MLTQIIETSQHSLNSTVAFKENFTPRLLKLSVNTIVEFDDRLTVFIIQAAASWRGVKTLCGFQNK